jgi:hypothetical protein
MDGTSKQRKTEQEIIQLMEEFEKSDSITVKEFCEMQDISNATFYNWQKMYRSRQNENDVNGFVSLDVFTSAEERSESSLFAEVKGIKLYRQVSASFLKELAL